MTPAACPSAVSVFRIIFDKALSVSLQLCETMSQACVAELTPLSSCQSYKGTSVDSSHCHLEMLSLRRADTLPRKLLGHLAEGGGADSLSHFMLRFSGAGFAHYAPGPETSVWSGAQTLPEGMGWNIQHILQWSASQGSVNTFTMCIFWASPEWTTL